MEREFEGLCAICVRGYSDLNKRGTPQLIPCSGPNCAVKIHRVCSPRAIAPAEYLKIRNRGDGDYGYFCPKCLATPPIEPTDAMPPNSFLLSF